MAVSGFEVTVERVLDLTGVFVFALSGASLAARKRLDVVGITVLAAATALGGGMMRDLLLDDLPPVALRDQLYLAMPLAAAALVLVAHRFVERTQPLVAVFDAAGLSLFAVVGSAKALDHGLGVLPAIVLGVMTAVGGGVIRDVLVQEVPAVFRPDRALYAIPAALGGCATAAAWSQDALGGAVAGGIVLAVFGLRLLAIRFSWRAPTARGAA